MWLVRGVENAVIYSYHIFNNFSLLFYFYIFKRFRIITPILFFFAPNFLFCSPRSTSLYHPPYSLHITSHAVLQLQDVVADEPHQVGEVRGGGPVSDELQHGLVVDAVHVEGQCPHRYPDHGLGVVEELDGFGVQRKVVGVLLGRWKLLLWGDAYFGVSF